MHRMLKHYKDHELIEHAEPNYLVEASFTPNDPFFPYQYNLSKINAPTAWDITQSNSSVKIAIIDTGVQLNHPELASKLLPGYDYVDYDNIPEDGNGHGTHVAGIAASVTNNGVGIAGVAPLASIVPLRVLDNNGQGTVGNVGNGLVYAANNGVQVVNLSLGGPMGDAFLQAAVQYAWDRGAVIIAAAGNDNTSFPIVPASYPNVIAVASTNTSDLKSNFSNYGSWLIWLPRVIPFYPHTWVVPMPTLAGLPWLLLMWLESLPFLLHVGKQMPRSVMRCVSLLIRYQAPGSIGRMVD